MIRCCFFIEPVQAQVLFYQKNNKWRDVASNGTVVVYVKRGHPRRLDVVCNDISGWFRYTHLTTPLVNDGDLYVNSFPILVLSGLATRLKLGM